MTKASSGYILVSAPNKAGENFIRELQRRQLRLAALANSKAEHKRLAGLGVGNVVTIDTSGCESWTVPQFAVSRVFLFEKSLNLSCRYIQICRTWTNGPIYLVTSNPSPRLVYRGLGAHHVIYTNGDDVGFLIDGHLE